MTLTSKISCEGTKTVLFFSLITKHIDMNITHDFDLPEGFDTEKMKKMDKKVESGEVKQCSIENGPDCENCSG